MVLALALRTPSGWLPVPSIVPHSISICPYFLGTQISTLVPWVLIYISAAPVLKSTTSLRSLVPFLGEYYLETSIWALGMLVANGILLLLGCLSGQS